MHSANGKRQVPKVEISPAPPDIDKVISHRPRDPVSHPTSQNDRSLDYLTMDMKVLIKKIQDLSHLGLEDRQITLPKICVVGDQSTGKSSLIEGISEIQVPRAEGTCTRCPLEINLSQSDEPWKCIIHLSHRYVYDPSKGGNQNVKKASLGPWKSWGPSGSPEDEHFADITVKSELKQAIACAQLAVLNPNLDSRRFVPERNPDLTQDVLVKFSPNPVRLDISAPRFPNLSFYDLPGVISQTEHDHESYLVDLVENLVKSYVSQKNSIVLLTLPMTDDATNSSSARLVRNIPGAKERTLGVLTKPDRRPLRESFDQWEEILMGTKFKLGHGYYVIRNNPDPEVSHAQARREEDLFFKGNLWTNELRSLNGRFGVKNLLSALSELLKSQIIGSLPHIAAQVDGKLQKIDEELFTLPNPPTEDVQRILFAKTTDFERKIHEIFDGAPCLSVPSQENKQLQEQWNMIVLDLRIALNRTRPDVKLHAPKDKEDLAERVDLDNDLEIIEVKVSPSKKRKTQGETSNDSLPDPQTQTQNQNPYTTKYFEGCKPVRFSLQLLSELRFRTKMLGVPNHLDPRAIENLNKKCVEHWEILYVAFLRATHGLVHGTLLEALEQEFQQYHQTGLYQELTRVLKEYLQKARMIHLDTVKDYFKSEHEISFTMAQERHHAIMDKTLKELQARRDKSRIACYLAQRGENVNDEKFPEKIRKFPIERLPPDRYTQEIEMMASSLAYYDIASSRFLDNLCQSTIMKLFRKCRSNLVDFIRDELQIFGDNGRARCLELMAEDAERQQRRAYLQKEREKFAIAQEWLQSLRRPETENHMDEMDIDDKMCEMSPNWNADWEI